MERMGSRLVAAPEHGRAAILAGAVLGFTGVGAGAFAAHALRTQLDADALGIFETAARYQLVHAVALLAASSAYQRWPGGAGRLSVICFVLGTVIFSGSLYALSLTGLRILGALTPLGGILLLAAWLSLAYAALRGART